MIFFSFQYCFFFVSFLSCFWANLFSSNVTIYTMKRYSIQYMKYIQQQQGLFLEIFFCFILIFSNLCFTRILFNRISWLFDQTEINWTLDVPFKFACNTNKREWISPLKKGKFIRRGEKIWENCAGMQLDLYFEGGMSFWGHGGGAGKPTSWKERF